MIRDDKRQLQQTAFLVTVIKVMMNKTSVDKMLATNVERLTYNIRHVYGRE